jgi:hypothetical protein
MSTSTKTKTKKSVKSSTAAKAVKKSSKSKTKSTKKPAKKLCGCIPTPVYDSINDEYPEYPEYPELSSEFPYGDSGFDSMGNEVGITKYYYITNHDTNKKFVVSGYELPYSIAKIIGEEETGSKEVYIVKISSPIAWLINRVFKVESIDANNLLVEAIDSL